MRGDGSIRTTGSSRITTRFVVLTEGRSGSTLLVDELHRRWPEIRARKEVLSRDHSVHFEHFEDAIEDTYVAETGESIVGCKVFRNQISDEQLDVLLGLEHMHVILLRRRDALRRNLSLAIARNTGQFHSDRVMTAERRASTEERAVTLDVADLYRRVLQSQEQFEDFERRSKGLPTLEVWYEDLAADLDGQLRRVAAFLGAGEPAHESPPRLARQNPEPLTELIINYSEVAEFIRDVGLGEYLDMDAAEQRDLAGARNSLVTSADTSGAPPSGSAFHGLPCWTTATQRLLLTALVGAEELFEQRWEAWRTDPAVVTGSDDASFLYPAVHDRLRRSTATAQIISDFRFEAMRNTATKVRLLDALCEAAEATDGTPLTLLGSTALAAMDHNHDSAAFRSLTIDGLDIFVDPDHHDTVIHTLITLGWTRTTSTRTNNSVNTPDVSTGTVTLRREDLVLRLHASVARNAAPSLDDDLRLHLVTCDTIANTRLPAPAELLVSIIIDAIRTPAATASWVLDAHRLITDTDIDWDRFIDLTRTHSLEAPVHASLDLLHRLTDEPGIGQLADRLEVAPDGSTADHRPATASGAQA